MLSLRIDTNYNNHYIIDELMLMAIKYIMEKCIGPCIQVYCILTQQQIKPINKNYCAAVGF